MKLLDRLRKAIAQGSEPEWQPVVVEPSGFCSEGKFVLWSDVLEVAAFKRDMVTVDDVWFQFKTKDGAVFVCEEQPGFTELEVKTIALFPSAANWRQEVIDPPFARNFTVLYSRT